ncbi:MAG: hypothetical protein J6A83_04605 [Clostridia bacterium]|nr:hypothetical protein [Clostridia bacterium]
MKRRLCLLLALLMVMTTVFGLTSCKKKDGEGEETTVSTTVGGGDAAGEPGSKDDPTLYEDLPTGDYKGYTFTFLNNISDYANTTIVPTVTSDSVNQAMFQRNSFVKDKLKVNIAEERMKYADVKETMQKLTTSQEFVYDAVYNEVQQQTSLSTSGAYYSVEEYEEYINLSKPWWFTDAMESLQVDGRGFELFGDLQLMYYDSIWGMTFNQKILADNHQAYPYELVRKGEWTIDALKDIVAATAQEGSDENYGVSSHKDWILAMISGSNFVLVEQDEDEVLKMYEDAETFVNVYTAIMNGFFLSNGEEGVNYIEAEYHTNSRDNDFPNIEDRENWGFQNIYRKGKSAFMAGTIGDIQMIRSAEFEYGIVPTPKYNKDQEQYVSWIFRGAASCSIPAANPELERTCTILENLAAYSYKLVKYEYYDIVVQTRTVRDNDSIEMLDIIFGHHEEIEGTPRFEMDSVYEIGISNVIKKEMCDRSTNIQSSIAGASDVKKNIGKVIEGYKG